MIVSIHQPAYLPWLGYFDKIRRADTFVFLDNVQFQKSSFQNRNRIRTKDGWIWLTVPVETKGRLYETPLRDIPINNRIGWRKKHVAALRTNYAKAPYGDRMLERTAPFLARDWNFLADLCFEMLIDHLDALKISTKVAKASDMGDFSQSKSELILEICRRLGATRYLSGLLGRDYLDEASFAAAGIEVIYQDYAHPTYRQAYPGFEPAMGIVDALANAECPADLLNIS